MKLFDARKTGMIGLPYGEKNYDDMLSRFHTIPACHGRTDGQTDRIGISISRVSSRMLTRDKNAFVSINEVALHRLRLVAISVWVNRDLTLLV